LLKLLIFGTHHQRHKPLTPLDQPRELVLACPHFKSSINLSRIIRLASSIAVEKVIVCGNAKIDPKIAREGAEQVVVERRNSLVPVLKNMREVGYRIVGLEQTNDSKSLFEFRFLRNTVLVIGHERLGITDDQLPLLQDCIEIPVYGLPYSFNVVTATTMAVYEYCKQFPRG